MVRQIYIPLGQWLSMATTEMTSPDEMEALDKLDGDIRTVYFVLFLFCVSRTYIIDDRRTRRVMRCYNKGPHSEPYTDFIPYGLVYSLQGAVGLEAIRGTWVACRRIGVRARVSRKVRERQLRHWAALRRNRCRRSVCKLRGAWSVHRRRRGGCRRRDGSCLLSMWRHKRSVNIMIYCRYRLLPSTYYCREMFIRGQATSYVNPRVPGLPSASRWSCFKNQRFRMFTLRTLNVTNRFPGSSDPV